MLTSVAARPLRLTLLWRRLAAALTPRRAAPPAPGTIACGVDNLPVARLRDLGLEKDQVGGNISFAKGNHQRFF